MKFKPLDTVVLDRDVPAHGLRRGDLGAVVAVFEPDVGGLAVPVYLQGMYGLIIRRCPCSEAFISRVSRFGKEPDSDEHLVAMTVAMSYRDLQHASAQLVDAGCKQGRDFVETMSSEGIIGGVPDWLSESLVPPVISEEMRAKWPADIIAGMEATRWRVYALVEAPAPE